jgi:osmotically-inducible protein OsmY
MNTKWAMALGAWIGAGVGAGLMYLGDPVQGRRRRALVRDKAVHLANQAGECAAATGRHLANRARGMVIAAVSPAGATSDDVLTARVRSRLGRLVSHPHALDVKAHAGRVTLSGPVLTSEVEALTKGVEHVPGVMEVENRLDVHDTAANVPALQGGRSAA